MSSCIPTVMKNTPKSKSLNGIRSASIWCLYCVLAIISPAMNAPREYENPNTLASCEEQITMNNMAAMKISSDFAFEMKFKNGVAR